MSRSDCGSLYIEKKDERLYEKRRRRRDRRIEKDINQAFMDGSEPKPE